jgi:hypothetical protein
MGLRFTSANSEVVFSNQVITTAVPFSVGFWVMPVVLAADVAWWGLTATASDIGYAIGTDSATASTAHMSYWNGATDDGDTAIATAMTAGAWHYVIGRQITSTNHRLSVLLPTGQIKHAQATTTVTPGTLVKHCIGAFLSSGGVGSNFGTHTLAEWWYAPIDVQPGGGQMADEMVRVLARNGPFGFPLLNGNVQEYLSLRLSGHSREQTRNDVYSTRGTTWSMNGSPKIADHPPLLLEPYDRAIPIGSRLTMGG